MTTDDLIEKLRDYGHSEECATECVLHGYPLDDDGGVCWCGLPSGWREPTQAELDAQPRKTVHTECTTCLGYGHMRRGKPSIDRRDSKCLDCNGTGVGSIKNFKADRGEA